MGFHLLKNFKSHRQNTNLMGLRELSIEAPVFTQVSLKTDSKQ